MDLALGIFPVASAVALYKRFRSHTRERRNDRLDVVSGLSDVCVLCRVAELSVFGAFAEQANPRLQSMTIRTAS